jgi:hypothetical protein
VVIGLDVKAAYQCKVPYLPYVDITYSEGFRPEVLPFKDTERGINT